MGTAQEWIDATIAGKVPWKITGEVGVFRATYGMQLLVLKKCESGCYELWGGTATEDERLWCRETEENNNLSKAYCAIYCAIMSELNAVNHPPHYQAANDPTGTYEAIKVIEACELNFHLGNVVKYILRAGKKDDALKDLRKAAWYLQREIERREKSVDTVSGEG